MRSPTPDERALVRAQRAVSRGILANEERKQLILRLYRDGMPQTKIARCLSRASVSVGGPPISEDAISHLVRRQRKEQE
jgi:hypothetical protein